MAQQARVLIDEHILETGNLLLQGLPITNPEACEAFVSGMGFTKQKYEPYGGVRQKVCGRVGAGCGPTGYAQCKPLCV